MSEGLKSTIAFILYVGGMFGAYIFAAYKTSAPFKIFAVQFTIGFGIYVTKRLIQRHFKFNGVNNVSVQKHN